MKKVKTTLPETQGVQKEFTKLLQAETPGTNTLAYTPYTARLG
jgi:hypothetical protein